MFKAVIAISFLIIALSIAYYFVIIPSQNKNATKNQLVIDRPTLTPKPKTSKLEEKLELIDSEGNRTGEVVTIREMYRRGLFDKIGSEDRAELTDEEVVTYCTNKTKKAFSDSGSTNASVDTFKKTFNIGFRLCLSENGIAPYDLL